MNNMAAKQNLTSQELQMLQMEFDKRKKSTGTTWLLWLFLGGLGGHRYYLGHIGYAIGMTLAFLLALLSMGILLFIPVLWALMDAFIITGALRKKNEQIEREIISELGTIRKTKEYDRKSVENSGQPL